MKKTKTPSLVTIAILTTITALFWVFFSIYRVFTTEPSPVVPPEILEPVSPSLDSSIIDKIQARLFFAEGEVSTQIQIATQTATPIATETATPTATPAESPTPTATATASPTP